MNQVISFKTLYQAYCVCRRRKRRTANAQRYEMQLFDNLYATQAALIDRSYLPSRCLRFIAQRPKAREIHAADFRDRVVHHWLVPQLEQLFEPIFIHDLYSNRLGKGTHKAVDRLQSFMHSVGNDGWYLQLDIANFFNSIDKPLLFKLLQQRLRKARDQQSITPQQAELLRWLCHVLLRHDASRHALYRGSPKLLQKVPEHKRLGHAGPDKGLPIGNLTSQFFANVYLNPLDQLIKHQLKCRHYLRYVDDFILLADNPEILCQWRQQLADFLQNELQLQLKTWMEPRPVKSGADFLGYIVRPHYRLVRRRVVGNLREKCRAFQPDIVRGNKHQGYSVALHTEVIAALQAVLASYQGHFKHANSQRLQQAIASEFPWLGLLFGITPMGRLYSLQQPGQGYLDGYQRQIDFFQQHYPAAVLSIQRGKQTDVFLPRLNHPMPGQADPVTHGSGFNASPNALELRASVYRVDVREQGHLRNGLKRRLAFRLLIHPGVELCPNSVTVYSA